MSYHSFSYCKIKDLSINIDSLDRKYSEITIVKTSHCLSETPASKMVFNLYKSSHPKEITTVK